MNKNKFLLPIIGISSLCSLSSCVKDTTPDDSIQVPSDESRVVMPSGAPTLSAFKLINEKRVQVEKNASNIPAYFSNAAFPFIVFDSTKGINLIEKAGENAHYEFVKMLTGGNFHLFAFNKSEDELANLKISQNDYVLGFQKGGAPDQLFKAIYKEANECDIYFNDVSSLKEKLLTMSADYAIDNTKVDYAIIAEPVATAVKAQLTKKGLKIADINLQQEFKKKYNDKWDKDYIPQAGLFVRNDIKDKYPKYYEDVINCFSSSIDEVLSDTKSVKESIESAFSSTEEQTANYGFASSLILSVQGNDGKKNGFGIVPNDIKFTKDDIKSYNSLLNSK